MGIRCLLASTPPSAHAVRRTHDHYSSRPEDRQGALAGIPELHAWLDGFPRGKLTEEAAAFLYLAEGVEEIR